MWESDTFALDMDLPVDVDEGKTKKLCIRIGNPMLLYGATTTRELELALRYKLLDFTSVDFYIVSVRLGDCRTNGAAKLLSSTTDPAYCRDPCSRLSDSL